MTAFPRLVARLGDVSAIDDKLRAKFAQPGRVLGTVERVVTAALDAPGSADGLIRQELRDARYLHSRERRLVADAINDLLRYLPLLSGSAGTPGDVPAAWQQWLAQRGGGADVGAWLQTAVAELSPHEAVQLVGHVGEDLAKALVDSVDVDAFLSESNSRADVILRVNRKRGTPEQLHKRLAMDGIITREATHAKDGLVVEGRPNLRGHRMFRDGWFEVQDEASQCLVDLVSGDGPVVDWCAGAGGKSLALASRFPKRPVFALDVRSKALQEMGKRAKRAGVSIRSGVHGQDAPNILRKLGAVQSVVVDAPCTGTGVWRRHPAYRLGVDGERIDGLVQTQQRVLHDAAKWVAPGGQLVYATCSVLRVENEGAVAAFLERHPEFTQRSMRRWDVGETDGFFTADLVRER